MTIAELIDDYEGELARKGRSRRTITSYRWTLWKFADAHPRRDVGDITREDCERFLNRWSNREPSTMAQRMAALAGFFAFLAERGIIQTDPMAKVKRPKRKRADQLDIVTVSSEDVLRLFEACRTPGEAVCLALLAYTGARRGAASSLRWRDVDLAAGELRFRWKGGGVHVLSMSEELRELLTTYLADIWQISGSRPDDYVIPNLRPAGVRRAERDDRIVWNTVRRVALRAGIRAHVHALRSAFAVFCLEGTTIDVLALRDILGHERVETTLVYLRRRDRKRSIDQLRGLSWGAPRYQQEQWRRIRDSNPCSEQEPSPSPSDENTAANALGAGQAPPALIDNPYFRALLERLREGAKERQP